MALLFRTPLLELIPALRRLRFKEFEVEFERGLLDIENVKGTPVPSPQPAVGDKMLPEGLQRIATIAPSTAVLEAWKDVEVAAVELATRLGLSTTGHAWELVIALKSQSILNTEQITTLEHLRKLRNKIVHESEPAVTEQQALRYAAMAMDLAQDLQSLDRQAN